MSAAEQSLAADGAIACLSSNLFLLSLNADRAPQLKASVMRNQSGYLVSKQTMKPILGKLCVAILFCVGLCIAQEKTNRTPTGSEDLSAGFQCPGKDSNQPRPNVKIKLGDVTKKAVKLPKPRYPQLAKAAGLYGNVKAEVVINMNSGAVIWAQVISGHPLLKEAVKDVVCGARFVPINDADGGVSGFLTYRFARRRWVPHNKALQLTAR